jgi:hypothetical protein
MRYQKAPNPKHQIPNKFQCSKFETSNKTVLVIGIWNLVIIWDLGFGIWDLRRVILDK